MPILNKMRTVCFLLVSLTVVLVGCTGLAGEPEVISTLPPRPTPVTQISEPIEAPSLTLGAQVYAANCINCHGITGAGDGQFVLSGQITQITDFTQPTATDQATPAEWFEIITNGRLEKLMPPWGGSLTTAERWSVTMYVYMLAYPPAALEQGEAIYIRECAECHGEDGRGGSARATLVDLFTKNDGELVQRIAQGAGELMPAYAESLSEEEQKAVLAHVRSLSLTGALPPALAQGGGEASISAGGGLGMGTVYGQVQQGTANASLPQDMTARLHILDREAGDSMMETTVNPDGTYQFDEVDFNTGHAFVVFVEYDGGSFMSDFLPIGPGTSSLELPVTVYDLTDDSSVIQVASLVSQVFHSAETLQVIEIVELRNNSDRIYVGAHPEARDSATGRRQTVSVRLPEGAHYLDIMENERYTLSEDGRRVFDSLPVLPGEAHIMHLTYEIPYDRQASEVVIRQPMDYALMGPVEVHFSTPNLAAESANGAMLPLGTINANAMTLYTYGGVMSVEAGNPLEYIVISNIGAGDAGLSQTAIAAGLVAAGLVVATSSGVLIWWERRRHQRAKAQASRADGPDAEMLMQEIAALDMQYQAGEIDEKTYHTLRDALKAQVSARLQVKKQDGDDNA